MIIRWELSLNTTIALPSGTDLAKAKTDILNAISEALEGMDGVLYVPDGIDIYHPIDAPPAILPYWNRTNDPHS